MRKAIIGFSMIAAMGLALVSGCADTRTPVEKKEPETKQQVVVEKSPTETRFTIGINNMYGYIDGTGGIVIQPQFRQALPFSEGLAAVATGDHCPDVCEWGFINEKGEWVVKPDFSYASSFSEGRAVVGMGDCPRGDDCIMGYVGKDGKMAMQTDFDTAMSFKNGVAVVVGHGNRNIQRKWMFIDENGKQLDPEMYSSIWIPDGDNGLYAVKKEKKCEESETSCKWGFTDGRGNLIIEAEYDGTSGCSEGICGVKKDGKWGYIKENGEAVGKIEFDKVIRFSGGRAPVKKEGKWGIIDTEGNFVKETVFDDLRTFGEGLAAAGEGEDCGSFDAKECWYGYVDADGNQVIEKGFKIAGEFENGLALVGTGEECNLAGFYTNCLWGYIDREGEYVWNPTR